MKWLAINWAICFAIMLVFLAFEGPPEYSAPNVLRAAIGGCVISSIFWIRWYFFHGRRQISKAKDRQP
jgi:hypothetical protein